MCIAENKLSASLLMDKISSFHEIDEQSVCYADHSGLKEFKCSLAKFMSKRVFNGHNVDENHLIVASGCTALLYELSVLLFNPGDALLIPVPYYPMFVKDFKSIGQVHIEDVSSDIANDFTFSLADLDAAYIRAQSKGHPPKALLLTNPHNPLGSVLSGALVRAAVAWCRSKHMHCIVDEIYALSTFNGIFESIVPLLNGVLGNDVHVLWGLSKDLGASGLRVGVLYSHNQKLLSVMKSIACAFQCSPHLLVNIYLFVFNNYSCFSIDSDSANCLLCA